MPGCADQFLLAHPHHRNEEGHDHGFGQQAAGAEHRDAAQEREEDHRFADSAPLG
jgi:hypothetical protein